MVILRATHKVLRSLPASAGDSDISESALGDWYVNRIVIHRRPLLLLVSSSSLLAILTLARDVKNLPQRLAGMVETRLHRLSLPATIVGAEVAATRVAKVGRTVDRSVTGQMVDFAKALPHYLPMHGWNAALLPSVEDKLGETPCRSGRPFDEAIFPDRQAVKLLTDK